MTAMLECQVTMSCDEPSWREYLAARPDATTYHDPRWGQVMRQAYGNRPYYLTARRGERVVGVLQLVHQKSLLFGSHLCSLPYFDAAGALADDDDARQALTDAAAKLREQTGAAFVELRSLGPIAAREEGTGTISNSEIEPVPVRTDKITMWLSLPAGEEAMWKQLKTGVRTKVRKAQKNELPQQAGGAELLGEYHAVYVRAMRDLGSPPHSERFFRLICEAFGPAVRLFVVRHEGQPIAASFTLTDARAFHVPWSGSDVRFRHLSANRLMYWSMLAAAAGGGSPTFDFGRSTRGSGTHEFKAEWGAQEVPLHWQYIMPPGREMPDLRPDSPKYRLMVACWKKLPVGVARLLGPRLIGKLS